MEVIKTLIHAIEIFKYFWVVIVIEKKLGEMQ